MTVRIPRILLSGTSSRAGKTIVSVGLMRALKNRGYKVQPFKIGPDFIDPSFHLFATGSHSRNLDSYMMSKDNIQESFQRNAKGSDIAVIEGVMGLYDSHNGIEEKGSTAEVAKILDAPVILIANIERISRTAAAFVSGYKQFDSKVDIKGVLLNRAGSKRHGQKARLAVERLSKMKVLGVMPRDEGIMVPERHLGLIPAYEREELDAVIEKLAGFIEEYLDVDEMIELANNAPELEEIKENPVFHPERKFDVNLGIVKDKAFTFYYQDNLDAFKANGAKISYIDSLNDQSLPDIDALYIGGGFPEVFSKAMEENASLREDIKEFCSSGRPVYAECGGLMYLGEKATTVDGQSHEMVGFLPIETHMQERFQALGYARYDVIKDNPISRMGDSLVGHEFHYSKIKLLGDVDLVYKARRGRGVDGRYDGILKKNTLASYLHLHVLSHPSMIENFLSL
ncbi:MAG: cobyrinate a,c-diamide synthase, partial [Candidatus Hydrothermarchaeales archaeon]